MKFRYHSYLLQLIFLLITIPLASQYKFNQPVILDKEKGLPTNNVRAIAKGSDGFIWIATLEGLCRFDGLEVKVFKLNNDSAFSFFDNSLYTVVPSKNEVWVGSNQGISVLNTKTETFRHYQLGKKNKEKELVQRFDQRVETIFSDKQKRIWIGSRYKGLWYYDPEQDDFKKIEYPEEAYHKILPALASQHSVLSIAESKTNDSIIWAGTTAGLQEVNKYNGKVTWYTYAKEDKFFQAALNAFRRLYHHDNGLLYVGSWGAGVNVFDPVSRSFTPLPLLDPFGKDYLTSTISSIERKNMEELWITTGHALLVYNTTTKKITWAKENELLKYNFYGVDFIDESGRIWDYNINGVRYFDPVVQQFASYSYEHLFSKGFSFAFYLAADTTQITVCPRFTDGLFHFNKRRQQWTKSPFNIIENGSSKNFIVRGFVEAERGQYILSTDQGLFLYTKGSDKLQPAPRQPKIQFSRWGEVMKDHTGNIWLCAADDGLLKWNIKNGQYRIFKEELILDTGEPDLVRVDNPYEDSHHNIWISRTDGFSLYLASKDSIINFIYSKTPGNSFPVITDFKEDKNGKIWVAGPDGWYGYIMVTNPEKGIVKKFNLKDNGFRGFLVFLAKDKNGNIWGYTPYELIKINADDISLSAYSFYYGVKTVDFFHFSFLPSGEMVFGERNGITMANPEELKKNTELPVPYIVQLKILNRVISRDVYSAGEEIELSYRKNFLTIYFSAKAYTVPEGVRFRYRLYDFDDWNEVKGGQFANYTNIPPGHYVFQLQAANNEGVWNENILEMPFHIITPWWLTWWFRIGILLLLAGIIYSVYKNRINQIKKKEKLKTRYEKKLANVEMTALLAQMNPHFLFNSLNSIDSYIIKNESGKASEYLNNFARLMRLILQSSRSNYTSLKDEIEMLDLYLQMEALRFKDKFQYEINVSEVLNTSSIVIPPMLVQPYVENAIWHGLMHKNDGIQGKVEIIISEQENKLICIIQDNGIGREKAAQIKARKPGNHKRSMGMQITKDRIDLINKLYNTNATVTITDLQDNAGKPTGTRVELSIPF